MNPINVQLVQAEINKYKNKPIYLHLETTNGAYAAHRNEGMMTVSAFIRNGKVEFSQGKITGDHPYRVGLHLEDGWVYAQGLTDWEVNEDGQLLLAGHDSEGKIAIALQLSEKPFI
ncbi:YojF family protein [Anaerobacillus sp. CMMVII]|uniref:YojF family protein n=1 Tax=Anaerobacillus sp. CMMVII TaxID=2755588 RepID=UPI0021B821A3|nr:YojF family protein [Anaerobacillus sp. CMMVII]MCT8138166.1 YojF family protein [Anaerobacillus sp. CMMVII]